MFFAGKTRVFRPEIGLLGLGLILSRPQAEVGHDRKNRKEKLGPHIPCAFNFPALRHRIDGWGITIFVNTFDQLFATLGAKNVKFIPTFGTFPDIFTSSSQRSRKVIEMTTKMVFIFLFIWLCRKNYFRSTPKGFYLSKIKICICKIK